MLLQQRMFMGYNGCVAGLESSGCAFVKCMAFLEFRVMLVFPLLLER